MHRASDRQSHASGEVKRIENGSESENSSSIRHECQSDSCTGMSNSEHSTSCLPTEESSGRSDDDTQVCFMSQTTTTSPVIQNIDMPADDCIRSPGNVGSSKRCLTQETTYTRYCKPSIKLVLPEQSTMTPEIFAQVDSKVCRLYTLFTNHYQFWLRTKEDYGKPSMNQEYSLYLERKLQMLEEYLADIHVDIERCVTFYEVQAAVDSTVASYLSTWQKKNLIAIIHHLSELKKLQREENSTSQLYAVRQQKIEELTNREISLKSELLIPPLPADSPGNNTRCLSSLLTRDVMPAKAAFIRKKVDAINKFIRRSTTVHLPANLSTIPQTREA